MNKIFMLFATVALTSKMAMAQTVSASAITNVSYLQNPKNYTSKIDTNKIKSKILIDRSFYSSLILNVNGTSKVTSITNGNWASIYESLQNANSDTIYFPAASAIETAAIDLKKNNNVYALALLNIDFKRIKEIALANGEFSQEIDFLKDIKANANSFENIKAFAGASLFTNIFGDDVFFTLPKKFIFNNTKENISKIEIDFGNGLGFQTINTDDKIAVHYSNANNEFIEIKIKATVSIGSAAPTAFYTHFTLFRKSSSTIKIPASNKPSIPGNYNIFEYYPKSSPEKVIEYNFLINANNKSGKLRRPFIVCDGFDYGDRRNYFETISTFNSDKSAPEDNNTLGLYENLDGTPTPWTPVGEKHPHLVDSLLKYGYDLVFVNFKDGAGDVFKNASHFRGFLNTVINKEMRDSLTEENVVVGPSMGGLITRMAITSMEKAGEDHFVKIWISFDSPQKGANIPIALQHNVNYASTVKGAKDSFIDKIKALNSIAALQLLKHHYTKHNGISQSTSSYVELYNSLDTLGYPKLSKNYGITNGGKALLYSTPGTKIVNFKSILNVVNLKGWGQNNSSGTYVLADNKSIRRTDITIKSTSQIPLDNAPGGWNDALNSLNFNPANQEKPGGENYYKWACFIPTTSAMGYDITNNSIFKTWESFTNCNDNSSGKLKTPFDEIHGMETNEEHTKISAQTGAYVVHEFKEYMKSTVRPVVRNGNPIDQVVKGKVAYLVIDTIQLASTGDGNTYTLSNTADVNIRAGKTIQFHQGFKAVAGSKMNAKIVTLTNTPYSSIASSYKTQPGVNANPATPSPFLGKVYDYTEKTNTPKAIVDDVTISVFPNPTERVANIHVEGLNGNQSTLEIFNALGTTVFSEKITNNGTYQMDISFLPSGVYFFKVKSENSEAFTRVIKI